MFSHIKEFFTRPSGYNLNRSVRLRSSASAYLNRTPASAGNQKTWTWSGWVKRGVITPASSNFFFFAGASSASSDTTYFGIYFSTGDALAVTGYSQAWRLTSQVFRDPSAWYHIVVAFDTTQATGSNRVKVYVNGSQITSFSSSTDPSLNTDYSVNSTVGHSISGRNPFSASTYFDGYLTEINFVDGQALTPSSFGSTNAVTGVWQPAKYTGTYGTNGFYLNFSNNASTTTLGYDTSGNSNNWTTNNISLTSGATYDSMTDVPTLTSLTAANYCVLNPLNKSSSSTVSNGNLRQTSSGGWYRAYSTIFFASTAVFYAEATMTALNSGANGVRVGIANANSVFTYLGSDANSWSYDNQGPKYNNGTLASYGASYAQGDVIGILFNNGSLTFYKNGTSQGVAYSGLTGTFCFAGSPFDTDIVDWNFGQRPFSNLPSGALALNTFNLPASTIVKGNTVMDATTYTGTGSTQTITNSGSMKPDFVWMKSRSAATSHHLADTVRGIGATSYLLLSNTTDAESTSTTNITAVTSSGFTVGSSTAVNNNGATYVGWQWQAGQGSSSSNTNGSITSTVSVNATAGFSIVTYAGNATAGATVGHGLGAAPKFLIWKPRNAVSDWMVWHSGLSGYNYDVRLNTTAAQGTGANPLNNTAPSSTVVTLANQGDVNGSGKNIVMYAWSEVAGFSKFGSYTGNGSSDGPFVYCGFRPRWVMVKNTTNSGGATNWTIQDSSRNGYNPNKTLYANAASAEDSSAYFDILSNGFKVRDTFRDVNTSGDTYIYAVFAENPTKYALAR
jgi:hypothetical protein